MTTTVASSVTRPPLPVSPIQLNGAQATDIVVRGVTIKRSVLSHDEVKLTVTAGRLDSTTFVDLPIYFRFGTNPYYGYFWGYTTHATKPQKFQENSTTFTITALGHSSVGRGSTRRSFSNTSTSSIFDTVAAGLKLGSYMEPHWFTHAQLGQYGKTDWEFLVRLGRMTGSYVYSHDGVVWATHPLRELEKKIPLFYFNKSAQLLDNRSLLDFVPSDEVRTVKKYLYPEFSYFSSNGSLVSHVPDVDRTQRVPVSDFIYNDDYARLLIESAKVEVEINQEATARVRGTAHIVPGVICDFNTGVKSVVKDQFDGLWYVTDVTHEISDTVFQTNLSLVRDKYRRAQTGEYLWYYENHPRRRPTMSLQSGEWVSSWR